MGNTDGLLHNPQAVAHIANTNTLLVCDTNNHRAQVFSLHDNGAQFQRSIGRHGGGDGQLVFATGIAVTRDGKQMVVADYGNHRLQLFDIDSGSFVRAIGWCGGGEGQLCNPQGVAVDRHRRAFVADYGNGRIQVFKLDDASFVRSISSRGVGQSQLLSPHGIAVDDAGRIVVVSDCGNHCISVFDTMGQFLHRLGAQGSDIGMFNNPLGLAMFVANGINRPAEHAGSTGGNGSLRQVAMGISMSVSGDGEEFQVLHDAEHVDRSDNNDNDDNDNDDDTHVVIVVCDSLNRRLQLIEYAIEPLDT
jgi:DNA-binding beta-propeller fold protein YncE